MAFCETNRILFQVKQNAIYMLLMVRRGVMRINTCEEVMQIREARRAFTGISSNTRSGGFSIYMEEKRTDGNIKTLQNL